MSRIGTQKTAMMCVYHMWLEDYQPATIINAGTGGCPEKAIWDWMYPDAKKIAIDPRRNRGEWDKKVHGLLGATDGKGTFCRHCKRTTCRTPDVVEDHIKKGHVVEKDQVTIDTLVQGFPPPYFIWMDIDGSELEALKGAT